MSLGIEVSVESALQLVNQAELARAEQVIELGRGGGGDELPWRRCEMEVRARRGDIAGAMHLAEALVAAGRDDPQLWHTIARLHLALGNFSQGLRILDALRPVALHGDPPIETAAPLWAGDPLEGKTLCLATEGGVGDVVCFARFATDLAARGAQVVLATYPEMFSLVRTIAGGAVILDRAATGRVLLDAWLPALSAPRLLGVPPSELRGEPYLRVDKTSAEKWGALVKGPGLRVGLCWQGRRDFVEDHLRSLDASLLLPFLDGIAGVSWHKVQLWEGDNQLTHPALLEHTDHIGCINDMAGLISKLDLLISVDSGPAHLAGALGVPVCLLNRSFGWITFSMPWAQRDRFGQRSPWYDSMRVFTQTTFGAWHEPLQQVESVVRALAALGPQAAREAWQAPSGGPS